MSELGASLVGKIVTNAFKDAEGRVVFETNAGEVVWDTEGDCCSQSWVEHVDLDLVRGEVLSVREDDLPPEWYAAHPGPPEQDSLALYGVTIQSVGGTGTIDFRNESNGYYGGWIFPVLNRS